jgi:hypothetical protein
MFRESTKTKDHNSNARVIMNYKLYFIMCVLMFYEVFLLVSILNDK